MRFASLSLAAAGLALGACRPAAKPAPAPTPAPNAARPGAGNQTPIPGGAGGGGGFGGGGGAAQGGAAQDPAPRPYASIITPRATTKNGVFKVHQVGARLYFEIPRSELGKDYVIVTTLASTPDEIGIRGTQGGNNLVRFERRDHRIFVREADYSSFVSDTSTAGRLSFDLINVTKILAALNIEAYGPDSSAVVEVTRR